VPSSLSWTYNSDFSRVSESTGGSTVTFGYDNDGLLVRSGDLVLTRDAASGTVATATIGKIAETYHYNNHGDLQDVAITFDGAPLTASVYGRDTAGRITSITHDGTVTGFSYDAAGRLQTATAGMATAEYAYDANGNRTSRRRIGVTEDGTYDAQDRLLAYGGTTFTYTPNGDLKTSTTGSTTTTFAYDSFGNLRNVSLPGVAIEYLVDAVNRRVGKKINGTLTRGWTYADGFRIITEVDGGGATVSRFVYGSRINVPDYFVRGGETYRIIANQIGSPELVVNVATGVVAQRMEYDQFGAVLTDTNPGFQPFAFAGGLYDRDTGLVRFGTREYDPHTGRWTSKDPLAFGGGDTNFYAYSMNDPINLIDPSGLLFGGTINAGEAYGQDATEYYADVLTDPESAWYEKAGAAVGGAFAALWTPCTSDQTFTVLSTAAGGAGGLRAAGSKAAGKEFSHWIPGRALKDAPSVIRDGFGLSRANGNYVSAVEHALNDPYRYRFMPAAWKNANPINSPLVRQINRFPKAVAGTGAGAAIGGGALASGNCGCQ
jgi:RHS repeat-associated protein